MQTSTERETRRVWRGVGVNIACLASLTNHDLGVVSEKGKKYVLSEDEITEGV